MTSVFWRCWLGSRKGIRPVKTEWWGAGMVVCLERGADLHMAQLMPLPLTVCCFSKIQTGFSFMVPAHLGSPRQRVVKRLCVCVCVPGRFFHERTLFFTQWKKTCQTFNFQLSFHPLNVSCSQSNHRLIRSHKKSNKKSTVNIPALEWMSMVRLRLFASFVNLQKTHKAIKQMCCLPTK